MKNSSFGALVAAMKNGHVDRDHYGNDISYLTYLKNRRRECKEKGITYDAEEELIWFRRKWHEEITKCKFGNNL